jgi:hypothetical protein
MANNRQVQFEEAIFSSDKQKIETIKALLKQGNIEIDKPIKGVLALHFAASQGDAPLVELLLKHQASPVLTDEKGKTAIETAMDAAMVKLSKMRDEEYESVKERYQHVVEKFRPSFPKIGAEVLNKLIVPFLKLAPSSFARVILIRILSKYQGIHFNQTYMMPTSWGSVDEMRPLHYLVTQPGSHQEIKLLLERDADLTLTCARNGGRNNQTAIEEAADFASRTPALWENILTMVQHAKTPIAPALLGPVLYRANEIQELAPRQKVLNALFAANASLTAHWEKDELFPKEGTLEEKNTFAAVKFIDRLVRDIKDVSSSRGREDIWVTIQLFLSFVTKAALEKKLPTLKMERPFLTLTTFSNLGDVLTLAILANTKSSNAVANRLIDLEAVDANCRGDIGGGKSSYPLMIAAKRNDRPLMLKLLGIGANPNTSREFQGYSSYGSRTVLDVLVDQKAWDFIPAFIAASKVKIQDDDLGHVVRAAEASADPAVIASVAPVSVELNESRRRKQEEEEKKVREIAEREAAAEQSRKAAEKAEIERQKLAATLREAIALDARLKKERDAQPESGAPAEDDESSESKSDHDVPSLVCGSPPAHIFHRPDASSEIELERRDVPFAQKQANFAAAFKKILVILNETAFMKDKGALEPADLFEEINRTADAHPHSRVAFAYQLAQKHHQNFNQNNLELVLALRRESFKRKLCSQTIANNLTFYRVKSFDKYIGGLTAADVAGVVKEMHDDANDDKCDTRSAFIIRELRKF